MRIQVEVWPYLSDLIVGKRIGKLRLDLDLPAGTTLGGFLDELKRQRPDVAAVVIDAKGDQVKSSVVMILNDQAFELVGLYNAELKNGDVITLLPAYSGG